MDNEFIIEKVLKTIARSKKSIAWARKKCQDDGIDATNMENLRVAFGDAKFKIHFCSMTAQQFATIGRQYAGLVSAPESIEVFHAILLRANGVKSSTFGEKNGKVRNTYVSLECSFRKGSSIKQSDTMRDWDWLEFCDTAIHLNGFVICNRMDVNDFVVKIQDGHETVRHSFSIEKQKLYSMNLFESRLIIYMRYAFHGL